MIKDRTRCVLKVVCLIALALIGSAVFAANLLPTPSNSPSVPSSNDQAEKGFIPYHQLKLPTLNDEATKGFIPYHQLTIDDFPIDDQVHPDGGFWVQAFIHFGLPSSDPLAAPFMHTSANGLYSQVSTRMRRPARVGFAR